ncbi:MAG: 50S ribosomal protein L4 [Chitinivibrionales bacterium]|nr:50S ribosomal protein L4 [Chitinivibrionales bacterium]
MKARFFAGDGSSKGAVDLPESVFNAPVNNTLLHQVITSYRTNGRQGTANAKSRSEVSGGGSKPWRQKGTGRSRAGANTSPVWVRGGKAFGPSPRNYTGTIPKKMRKIALKSALSSRAREDRVIILENLECGEPRTKTIAQLLAALSLEGKRNLLVTRKDNRNIYLSGRNIPWLEIKTVSDINALDVIRNENIIFGSEQLVAELEGAAKK